MELPYVNLNQILWTKKIKNKIVSIYTGLLNSSTRPESRIEDITVTKRDNTTSPDFIDYDGMGNQGRFPSRREKWKTKSTTTRVVMFAL